MTRTAHDGPALLPEQDLSVWWDLVGRWYAPVWVAAAVAAAIAYWIARRVVKGQDGESAGRARLRDAVMLTLGAVECVGLMVGCFAVFRVFHTHVGLFFFSVGVAFWTCALAIPAIVLLTAAVKRDWLRSASAVAILGVAGWMLFVEPNRVGQIDEHVKLATLPAGTTLRIAHLSDIQTVEFSEREERALEIANAFDPDIVVVTGDLTASGQHPVLVEHLRGWLRRLKSKTSRFVVNGDSDGDFDSLVRDLPEVTYLKDRGVSLTVNGAPLWICGLDNRKRPPEAQRAFEGAPANATRIFLAHNPDYFLSTTRERAHLGLAGHTHGGQVHVPGFGPLLTFTNIGPRYAEGLYRSEDLESSWPWNVEQMVICPGIGMEGGYAPRVRFLCPPRVVLLTLDNK